MGNHQVCYLACKAFDYKAAHTQIHLVLLELEKHDCHLDFKLLDENNYVIIQGRSIFN